ncbi:SDR family NAD(P)-dependent oxidoreductase [Paenibacillus alvei]|uniref:Polyketide synthase n=1 Tax=Paenibacillus alvei TaxID=44250 RepID=A0A383RBG9_PAEAL|nr:SDR family NAD(P)-dependent oxidoreductase [Paenibacillus alvei]SYX83884.1 protein of unknown function [Paenibacillus alvei]
MHTVAGYDYIHLQKQHMHEMSELLVKLLWEQLCTIGEVADPAASISALKAKVNWNPMYDRWLDISLHFIKEHRNIAENDKLLHSLSSSSGSADSAWKEWERRKTAWTEDTNTKAQVILAETMLRALPQILTNRKTAAEIMFPNSALDLVEGIYKYNRIADYFNEKLADAIVLYIEEQLRQNSSRRIRMLEIGAGTGGTSATIFRKLEPYRQHIEEYCYTDVSKAFLLHAEQEYGAENPFLAYKLLNIEKPIAEQDFQPGHYHIVIAANVLHATKNMRHTIRNAKGLLQKNGLLLLNEITERTLFNHVTFGLLPGWWLYEDEKRRIPGCPGLYCDSWKKTLEMEGYRSVSFPAREAKEFGQQIIVAESDGRIRLIQKAASNSEGKAADPGASPMLVKASPAMNGQAEHHLHTSDSSVEAHVKQAIVRNISESLKVETHLIDHEQSFSDYGVDSITGVQLVQYINRTLEVDLESTDLFDYNSVNQLAKYILSRHSIALKKRLAQQSSSEPDKASQVIPIRQTKKKAAGDSQPNRFFRVNNGSAESINSTNEGKSAIAIIGMSGRFAGSASVDELWTHLANGTDLIREASRWNLAEHYPEGADYCKFGSFVDGIDRFDPLFFNISGIEATYMDPQQRIFLELAWSALEDAGYAGTGVQGKTCGVYVGSGGTDYLHILGDNPPAQAFWGNSGSLIPARIAYYLDLQGPAIAVDTACSSSLVAIHLACQALWAGEIDMALAGGVFIQSTPNLFLCSNRAGMLSPSGRCHTFDERADGFVPGEGAGAIVMKRLDDAIADGDHIYGVIRGSGINQDGTTNGITAPSAKSQERLERYVYDAFGIHPEQIQMVEAHGTGTQLGDPIEYKALSRSFRHYTSKEEYCALGSIKTNIGHLTVAAGIAGVIKILLSLKHKQIPPSLHYRVGNSNITFKGSPFYVNTSLRDWIVDGHAPRRAAVSSFGFSGTNAHMVIEEAPKVERIHSQQPGYLIALSARSPEQLRMQANQLVDYCFANASADIGNMSYTLLLGRRHMNCRLACVARNIDDLARLLKEWLDTGTARGLYVSFLNRNEQHLPGSAAHHGNESIQACKDTAHDAPRFLEYVATVADCYVQGCELEFVKWFEGGGYSRISLPTYPFAKERYWVPTPQSISVSKEKQDCAAASSSEQVQTLNAEENSAEILMLEPIWEERVSSIEAEMTFYAKHIVMLCGDAIIERLHERITTNWSEATCIRMFSEHTRVEHRYEDYALAAFTEVQTLIRSKPEECVLIQFVVPRDGAGQLYAGLAGLLKTGRLENPKLIGQLIEIEPREAEAEQWIEDLKKNGRNPSDAHIRYAQGKRWVSAWREHKQESFADSHSLANSALSTDIPMPWKSGGIYLITGGAGGLGFILANDIARQAKDAVLILSGRTELSDDKRAKLKQLEAAGTRVHYRKADVADRSAISRLMQEIRDTWGRLDGIIHCAGIIHDNYILKKSQEELNRVLAPKVNGTVILDEESKDMQLDFFLLFSSLTGMLGNPGQADYAMANAFMDRYADYRSELVDAKQRHGVSISINWPLWKDGGMQVGEQIEAMMRQAAGMVGMTSDIGLQALYRALFHGKNRLMVLAGDGSKLRHYFLQGNAVDTEKATGADAQSAEHALDTRRLKELTLSRFRSFFAEEIKVGMDQIDVNEPLEHYGLDSVLVMQLNDRLERIFGAISKTLFYEYRTLREVANGLAANYPAKCAEWTGYNEAAATASAPTLSISKNQADQDVSNRLQVSKERLAIDCSVGADEAITANEPIAIIGLSGRYPQAPDLKTFWRNLAQGKDCISEIPVDRWPLDHFYDANRKTAFTSVKSYSKWGGFIDGFAEFDPRFFNISPREAMNIDPQERLFVMSCWEALEDAGYTKEQLSTRHKGRVGVYAGVTKTGYALHGQACIGKGGELFPFTSFGSIANRVSYLLDLKGPSMPIDTMCSSSLTAMHIACEHLRHGECEIAIAGGVNLYLHPSTYVELCGGQMLSSDGKCKSFGAGADGFVPGEGAGALILKPLSRAIADEDHIYAVIRATSMNHGGKTNGYRVPNPAAQGELVREAMDKAGVHARSISYIEAHGTGTELGDPIEITGLRQAFAADTADTGFCAIGSVKSNIGHLEAAAGIAGMTKVILQMKHGMLAPSLHAAELNPNISFSGTPFAVQRELGEWKRPVVDMDGELREFPRIAGVSSFGAGGVNAHVIVEEYIYPPEIKPPSAVSSQLSTLIVLSAKNEERLIAKAKQLLSYLNEESCTESDMANLAYTLQIGREAMDERLALIAGSLEELRRKLNGYVEGQSNLQAAYRGNAKRNKEALALFATDEDRIEIIDKWIERGLYAKLLEYWAKGFYVDWEKLYAGSIDKPRRISLPAYPFANERYWIPAALEAQPQPSVSSSPDSMHAQPPFVDDSMLVQPMLSDDSETDSQQPTEAKEEHETMIFEEVWREQEITDLSLRSLADMKSVVCFLSDASHQQGISEALWMNHPQTNVICISVGAGFRREASDRYCIRPDEAQSYKDAFRCIREEHEDVDAVLYLWAIEDGSRIRDFSGILYMLQAMQAERVKPKRLLLAGDFRDGLDYCYLDSWNGFKQSLRLVMPKTQIHVICRDAEEETLRNAESATKRQMALFVKELQIETAQSVLYRQGKRYTSQVMPIDPEPACDQSRIRSIRSGGTYLITGGAGGLGLVFAEALAENYRANLILIGRSFLNADKQAAIRRLEDLGSQILYVQADVCDLDGMRKGIMLGKQRFGVIHGVIHAAGVMSSQHVFEKSMEDFGRIAAPKITGTLMLDEALKGEALDFICYFSSTSAIIGDFGSCDYAVANRFQMSYGQYRNRIEAGRALVINWPLWKYGGMGFGNDSAMQLYMKTSGQRLLENDEGISLFEQLLSQPKTQYMVLAGQRERVHRFLGIPKPVEASLKNPVSCGQQAKSREPEQSQQPDQANPGRTLGAAGIGRGPGMKGLSVEKCVEWDLKQLAGQLLHIPEEQLDIEDHLGEFGFDSIGLADYAEKIAMHYCIDMSPALFFEYSTLRQVTAYIVSAFSETIQAFYGEEELREAAAEASSVPLSVLEAPKVSGEHSTAGREEAASPLRLDNSDSNSEPYGNSAPDNAEPIAIIGMSGRFPQARTIEELWNIFVEGREVIADMAEMRPYIRETLHSECIGGFVPGVDEFDPLFFEISPREAESMDPRQRLLLQEAWNALEDAGYGKKQLQQNAIGLFVGIENNDDYVKLVSTDAPITSNHNAVLAARLSYFLNLTGPNMAINTACSSGLVAVHQACMSLWLGECDAAMAAGVGLMLSVEPFEAMRRAGMLSAEGRCYAFDRRANGMVPGEAVAALVLKRLSRAEADGDPIYAVIRGSGINYDGKTNGITAPSALAQANLIKDVYRKYNINAEEIDYVVTHGTGTKLGDPVEVNALVNAFRALTGKEHYCAITSTKTNLGHTLAASGIVSLISLVQAMRHSTIPASLHFEQENEYIHWKNSPFYVNTQNRAWAEYGDRERMGAVSSFGMSGTNAHLVVQSYARAGKARLTNAATNAAPYLLPLSAKTEEALQEKIQQMIAYLNGRTRHTQVAETNIGQDLSEISCTLLEGRHHFNHRCAIVVADHEDAIHAWTQAGQMAKRPNIFRGNVPRDFEGQTALRQYMRDLMRQSKETNLDARKHQEILCAVAELYCQGYDIPSEHMSGENIGRPSRIHLPTYPFAREPYWAEGNLSNLTVNPANQPATQWLHPLLQANTSSFTEQRFSSTFTGEEFFLRDHQVMGRKVLPGVAYLEMARAAAEYATGMPNHDAANAQQPHVMVRLKHVAWIQPLDVEDGPVQLHIGLYPEDDGEISYEIYREEAITGERKVHGQGRAFFHKLEAEMPQLDIAAIQAKCNQRQLGGSDCYEAFEAIGLSYGEGHRGIERVYCGQGQVLAKLRLPRHAANMAKQFVLHPGMMDSALQAAIGLSVDDETEGSVARRPALPFALDELAIYAPYTTEMWARLRHCEGTTAAAKLQKLDIELCDEHGRVCVRMSGFASRLFTGESNNNLATSAGTETILLEPVWKVKEADKSTQPDYGRHIVMLAAPGYGLHEHLAKAMPEAECRRLLPNDGAGKEYESCAVQLFECIQEVIRSKQDGNVLIQLVVPNEGERSLLAGLAGMIKTARLENPKIIGQLIQVSMQEGGTELLQKLKENQHCADDIRIRYAQGKRWIETWKEWNVPQETEKPWKDGGLYVISGGAGGLGLIFAQEIAQQTAQATLILMGRTKLTADKQERLLELNALGARAVYRQVDVADKEAVGQFMQQLRIEFGSPNGIIHCAGVIRDNYILMKHSRELEEVLAPKVAGVSHLDEASKDDDLDFFFLFSSIAGAMGNPGQADYAAANAFMDRYAELRQHMVAASERKGRTLSINWPLWKEGGMRVGEAVENRMTEQTGMLPLDVKTGLEIFYQAFASGKTQMAAVHGQVTRMGELIKTEGALPLAVPIAKQTTLRTSAETAVRVSNQNRYVDGTVTPDHVEAFLLQAISDMLKVKAADIDADVEFTEYGLDQAMLAELATIVNRTYRIDLPTTIFYDHETVNRFAAYLSGAPFSLIGNKENHHETSANGADKLLEKAEHFLKKLLSSVLKLPEKRIEADAPLELYGIDSLMVMQLTDRLETVFGSLSKTLFFEYQTIRELTAYFLQSHWATLVGLLNMKTEAAPALLTKGTALQAERSLEHPVPARMKRRYAQIPPQVAQQGQSAKSADGSLDIAIIGLSGRYPGAANVDQFWDNLRNGKDCITEVPKDRWDYNLYVDENKNKMIGGKWGGFIEGVDRFDPLFFNISPREAEVMDPQERLFLECVYETIEDAGYTRESLSAHRDREIAGQVGVFVGVMYEEYQLYGAQAQTKGMPFALSGSPASIANRVSYYFNFHGPSMAVDTMCSSSLTSIHLACQSLQKNECELAIAGGVNVSVHPNKYLMLTQGNFLSSKGRCESFGEGGDGYVPGEGVGAVLLKPLSKAIADGDHIYGVIKATAVNHGGKTNGYTVPNPNAQASVIGKALAEADIHPRSVSYLEAHGTGTSLGDPIEIAGLVKAFRAQTPENQFCAIGSAKSNIGHCESAAGIAGVTKVLLQLKHRQLAPSLYSATLNPNIDFSETPFAVQQELAEWKRPLMEEQDGQVREYPRLAGISSFGAGGSNAHVIIEEYLPADATGDDVALSSNHSPEPAVIVLSAKNEERLQVQVRQLMTAIRETGYTDNQLPDIAYTLQVGREAMEERLAIITDSMKDLEAKLRVYAEGSDDIENLYRGQVKRGNDMLTAFAADEELQEAVGKWCERRKYDKLLELWVKGLHVDWSKLHRSGQPRKMSLPTYPFARERYWVPQMEAKTDRATITLSASPESGPQLHPLLHRNTSNLTENRFSSLFTGAEFFLDDHRVNRQRVLPGAAHLEMARAAVEQVAELADGDGVAIRLKHVAWPAPLLLDEQPVETHLTLSLEENLEIRYEIYSALADSEERAVFSRGRAILCEASEAPRLNLAALRSECNQALMTGSECYGIYERLGITYGTGHQGIDCLYVGQKQVLAKLVLPTHLSDTISHYVLHPSLIDSALQASIGLFAGGMATGTEEPAISLPFALDELEIFAPCTTDMWANIRYSDDSKANGKVRKLDIELCNEEGSVSVRITGFSSRIMHNEAEVSTPLSHIEAVLLEPCWQEQPATSESPVRDYDQHLVFLTEPFDQQYEQLDGLMPEAEWILLHAADKGIEQLYEHCAEQLFQHVQTLILSKPAGRILIQLITATDGERQVLAGLAGLLKTARQENPQIFGQLIETMADDKASGIIEKVHENSLLSEDIHIRYEAGTRLVESWIEVRDAMRDEAAIPWKAGGLYLITGGAGGLGLLFAQEIARHAPGATLILTGRSELGKEKQAGLAKLKDLGAEAIYMQTDVSDRLAVNGLIRDICDKFGQLNGIIHSAGVIRDNYLLKKHLHELGEVLAPKVAGTSFLDEATKNLNMDFFILFSSLTGATGNPGQADYAMANAFMDRFAKHRNELVALGMRYGHTVSINWPLWKEGGMQVDAETEKRMLQKTGLIPLRTFTGVKALYLALASHKSQIIVLEGDMQRLAPMIGRQNDDNAMITERAEELEDSEDEFFLSLIKQIAKDELTVESLEQFINMGS